MGDEIYFRDMWPWIWGEMNQLHGRVNISFGVKGTRGRGVMRFRSERRGRMGGVSAFLVFCGAVLYMRLRKDALTVSV